MEGGPGGAVHCLVVSVGVIADEDGADMGSSLFNPRPSRQCCQGGAPTLRADWAALAGESDGWRIAFAREEGKQ